MQKFTYNKSPHVLEVKKDDEHILLLLLLEYLGGNDEPVYYIENAVPRQSIIVFFKNRDQRDQCYDYIKANS